jgi:hypothetical protein
MPAIEPADLIADLRAKALRARLHAIHILDQETANKLNAYAEELEAQALSWLTNSQRVARRRDDPRC